MVVENAIQRSCAFFGELASFVGEFTGVVHTLASPLCPALYIPKASLQCLSLFRNLRIDHRRFVIAVIDIDAKRNEPVSNGILAGPGQRRVEVCTSSTASAMASVVPMGSSFGSIGGAGKGVACQLSSNQYSWVLAGFSSHRSGRSSSSE